MFVSYSGSTVMMAMPGAGMSSTFSEEMIAWYADRESQPVTGNENDDDDDGDGGDRGEEAGKQATLV